MTWDEYSPGRRPLLAVVLAAVLILGTSLSIVLASIRGSGPGEFGFSVATPAQLPADADIAGWVTFDKGSYLPGEEVRCRVRILWREDVVTPDFESFRSSVSFFPLDHRESDHSDRTVYGGIREYVADFVLQAVNVETTRSYLLATATVYYTSSRVETGELQALRINPPVLHIGELYPQDISDIPLLAPKTSIDEPKFLRQWLMALFGIALLGLGTGLIWRFGRRRAESSLSRAERLWYEFDALRSNVSDTRQFLLDCERIFVSALLLRTGIIATDFWASRGKAWSDWDKLTDDARRILSRSYGPAEPADGDVDRISALIDELLEPLVTEERLKRERLPSFAMRLKSEPVVLATSVSLAVMAIALFALAAMPSLWLSSDVLRYNTATALVDSDESVEQGFTEFSALAKEAEDDTVRAASLYNVGALLIDPRLSGRSPEQQSQLLDAIFLPEVTLDRLLHDLELDAVTELLGILTDAARRYVQAETAMKSAVRITPDDADVRRNLEMLGKIRRALASTVARLIDQGEQSAGLIEMQTQTIIDLERLMEVEMPEDFARLEEGKDDSNYFILEQF
jgi:hypothetical protein